MASPGGMAMQAALGEQRGGSHRPAEGLLGARWTLTATSISQTTQPASHRLKERPPRSSREGAAAAVEQHQEQRAQCAAIE